MPRYFFDIEVERMYRDAEGACLPDDEASRHFAAGISDVVLFGVEAPASMNVWIRTREGEVVDVVRRVRQDIPGNRCFSE